MGVDKELDYKQYYTVGHSPNSYLPSSRHFVEKRNAKGKPICKDDILSLKEELRGISFGRYCSSSCKTVPSKLVGLEGNLMLKQRPLCQNVKEVRRMKKTGFSDGRRKIEMSGSSGTSLSFKIVDSLCSSDEEIQHKRSLIKPQESNATNGFIEIIPNIDRIEKYPYANVQRDMTDLKTEFSPIRKMFDPLMKSKSFGSPLGHEVETTRIRNTRRNKTFQKSLLHDFSNTVQKPEVSSTVAFSPAHLHGRFKLKSKNGAPFFEFLLKCPEEVIVAKTWKSDNVCNWVYTFHSDETRKRNKVCMKESPIMGQMQVSCYICSELTNGGSLDNSMMTEFVLYDIGHARKNVILKSSDLYPWSPTDLHSNHEIAAIVMQIPFKDQNVHADTSPAKMKVVIPTGNHGLPSDISQSPSPLLDRWRSGGRCDCGGWDMACPLVVLGNPHLKCSNQLFMDSEQPFKLFVEGTKGNTPALTITCVEEGEYAVDFHAQLSTLQAFSICVAIFHTKDASSNSGHERNKPWSVLIEDEVKFFIEAAKKEEKRKGSKMGKSKEISSALIFNPPFSPIARV